MTTRILKKEDAAVSVDAKLVLRALAFAADFDVRFYLNGVCIQPAPDGGVAIMASDGHTAICLHDSTGKADRPVILPFSLKKHRQVLTSGHNVRMSQDGQIVVVGANQFIEFIHPQPEIDGKFPSLLGAVGDTSQYKQGLFGSFDPEYVERAIKAASAGGTIRFHCNERGIALFEVKDGFGLIMRQRSTAPNLSELVRKFIKPDDPAPPEVAMEETTAEGA